MYVYVCTYIREYQLWARRCDFVLRNHQINIDKYIYGIFEYRYIIYVYTYTGICKYPRIDIFYTYIIYRYSNILYLHIPVYVYVNIDSGQTDMNFTYVCEYHCILPFDDDAHAHMCKYIHKRTYTNIYARTHIWKHILILRDTNHRSLLQNIVPFIGLFCKRDLSF